MGLNPVNKPRVLITGGTPDSVNRNAALRTHLAEGFSDLVGNDNVMNLPFESCLPPVGNWRPDLVLVCGSCRPDSCDYSGIRRACDLYGSTLAFWMHEDPYEFDCRAKIVRIADHIFSNDLWASKHYHRENVWHLPLAASAVAHTPKTKILPGSKRRDVFFCGVGFPNRRRILRDLSQVLTRVDTEIVGDEWDIDELAFCRNRRIPNEQMPDCYASSRIVLNFGRDFNYENHKYMLVPSTPGPRTFEAAMAGACQMIFADSLEVMDYFENDSEIVLFDDPDDFEVKLSNLLDNPEKALAIGRAARERCLKEHTYTARAAAILERIGLTP